MFNPNGMLITIIIMHAGMCFPLVLQFTLCYKTKFISKPYAHHIHCVKTCCMLGYIVLLCKVKDIHLQSSGDVVI